MWIHYSIALEVFAFNGIQWGRGLLCINSKGSDPVTSDSESSDVEHYMNILFMGMWKSIIGELV